MSENNGIPPLGKIMIELDLDKGQYNVAFSNTDTVKLMMQHEVQFMFSPFHAACIVNELRRRMELNSSKIVKPTVADFSKFNRGG